MKKEQSSKHSRRMLIMFICCLVPILLILALIKFGVSSRGMFLLLILLCPLGHILMMRGGHHGHNQDKGGEKEMEENEVKDPVCGMTIKKDEAVATSEHMGKSFYFCSQGCKEKFDQEPMKYMGKKESGMSGCH